MGEQIIKKEPKKSATISLGHVLREKIIESSKKKFGALTKKILPSNLFKVNDPEEDLAGRDSYDPCLFE